MSNIIKFPEKEPDRKKEPLEWLEYWERQNQAQKDRYLVFTMVMVLLVLLGVLFIKYGVPVI